MVIREEEEIPSWSQYLKTARAVCENVANMVESQMISSAGKNWWGSLLLRVICITMLQRERN